MWKCCPKNLRETVERGVTRKISVTENPPGQDLKQACIFKRRFVVPTTQNVPPTDDNAKDRLKEFRTNIWKIQSIKGVVKFGQENNEHCRIKTFIPSLTQQFYNFGNDACSEIKRKTCGWRKQQKEKQQENRWNNDPHLEHSWLGVLGWSTALVLGWYLIQPLCRYWVFPCDNKQKWLGRCRLQHIINKRIKTCRSKRHEAQYVSLVDALAKTALAQPVFPNSQFENLTLSYETRSITVPDQISNTSPEIAESPAVPFGPPTADEALNEAAEGFLKVHNLSVSDIDNSLGVSFMKMGKQQEAVSFFTHGMEYKNPAATFNLAVCYEKGLGTSQDFKKAAKYYRLASEQGHATAMYNLGVFHVHGRGGLQVDYSQARALFEKASTLGQSDAKRALNMVSHIEENEVQDESTYTLLHALGLIQISSLKQETKKREQNLNTSVLHEDSDVILISNSSELNLKNLM